MSGLKDYSQIYEFGPNGLDLFLRAMQGQISETSLNATDRAFATPLARTQSFKVENFLTAKSMAEHILEALGPVSPYEIVDRPGVWAWLTFVLRDCLFPLQGGARKTGNLHRWFPSDPGDFQKAQRHLVRMPVLLLDALGTDADHLLCGKPGIGSEIREQLTSQQDMMSRNFQAVARLLYFDDQTGKLKRGAGGKERPGVTRRLAKVRQQLDITWDMTDLAASKIVELLPSEFDAFRLRTT